MRSIDRVAAIHPGHGGFGFVVMEGPRQAVDWGIKTYPLNETERMLRRVEKLLNHYRPDLILLARQTARRASRIQSFYLKIRLVACKHEVETRTISRRQMDAAFSCYGRTKQERALAVVQKLPQLAHWFPRKRRLWGGEDHRMKIFEAAFLGLTFYDSDSATSDSEARHCSI